MMQTADKSSVQLIAIFWAPSDLLKSQCQWDAESHDVIYHEQAVKLRALYLSSQIFVILLVEEIFARRVVKYFNTL